MLSPQSIVQVCKELVRLDEWVGTMDSGIASSRASVSSSLQRDGNMRLTETMVDPETLAYLKQVTDASHHVTDASHHYRLHLQLRSAALLYIQPTDPVAHVDPCLLLCCCYAVGCGRWIHSLDPASTTARTTTISCLNCSSKHCVVNSLSGLLTTLLVVKCAD